MRDEAARVDDPRLRTSLKAYEAIHPLAVLPIHRRIVEHELVNAGVQR
jgi:hypothetical protein